MAKDKKKILLTGSNGFLCSNFIRNLMYEKSDQYSVVGVDKITSSSALNNIFIHRNYTNYIADISDEDIFSRIVELEKPDIIIHAASSTNEEDFPKVILGTRIVSKLASKFNNRLIFISDESAYGSLGAEDRSFCMTDKSSPTNVFSSIKLLEENIIKRFDYTESYNIVRLANTYGSRLPLNNFIPSAVKSILNNEKIKIVDDGSHIRDWLHIKDFYTGILAIIEWGSSYTTYNLGANQDFSLLEVANLICKVMDKELKIESIDEEVDFRYSVDSKELKDLGWCPRIKFRDGIQNTVEWYVVNKYWLKG
jgi:dTDP-glucose 4,6-dehydratase